MNAEELKNRTKTFALRIIKLVNALPKNMAGRSIGNQLIRCGTSVAANYRAVCRARSRADFIAKLGIVEEEADESIFWIELATESNLIKKELISSLLKEANEILAIIISSKISARKNLKNNRKS
jgi:four helix bundle protein